MEDFILEYIDLTVQFSVLDNAHGVSESIFDEFHPPGPHFHFVYNISEIFPSIAGKEPLFLSKLFSPKLMVTGKSLGLGEHLSLEI